MTYASTKHHLLQRVCYEEAFRVFNGQRNLSRNGEYPENPRNGRSRCTEKLSEPGPNTERKAEGKIQQVGSEQQQHFRHHIALETKRGDAEES